MWSPPAPSAGSPVSLRTAKPRSEHHQICFAREHRERREAESCPRVPGQALSSGPELARGRQLLIPLSAQLPAPAVRQTFMRGPAGAGPAGASVRPSVRLSAFVQGGAISPDGWPQAPSVPTWPPAVFSPLTRLLTPEPNSWACVTGPSEWGLNLPSGSVYGARSATRGSASLPARTGLL